LRRWPLVIRAGTAEQWNDDIKTFWRHRNKSRAVGFIYEFANVFGTERE
jgi:hypothetical protein